MLPVSFHCIQTNKTKIFAISAFMFSLFFSQEEKNNYKSQKFIFTHKHLWHDGSHYRRQEQKIVFLWETKIFLM